MIDDQEILRHLREGGPELFEAPEPPRLDLDAIVGPRAPSGASPGRGPRRSWSLSLPVAIAGAAACVAIGAIGGAALSGDRGTEPGARAVASSPSTAPTPAPDLSPSRRQVSLARFGETAPAAATARASVFTASDGRTVELRVSGLTPPRKGEFYELWVLGRAGRMISLGIVRVDASGNADVRFPLPVSLRRFPVFDLSLEPGDGNPKHSGDSVLRSAAVI